MSLPGLLMDAFGRLPHLLGEPLSSSQNWVEWRPSGLSRCAIPIFTFLLAHKLPGEACRGVAEERPGEISALFRDRLIGVTDFFAML